MIRCSCYIIKMVLILNLSEHTPLFWTFWLKIKIRNSLYYSLQWRTREYITNLQKGNIFLLLLWLGITRWSIKVREPKDNFLGDSSLKSQVASGLVPFRFLMKLITDTRFHSGNRVAFTNSQKGFWQQPCNQLWPHNENLTFMCYTKWVPRYRRWM